MLLEPGWNVVAKKREPSYLGIQSNLTGKTESRNGSHLQ